MLSTQPLDIIPLWLFYPLTVALALLAAEIGYRLGKWWQSRSHAEKDPSIGAIVGSALALSAFLLAFVTGVAADRFNARRVLVIDDSNAIGTTYLRAGYLQEPIRTASRDLLREYVDERVNVTTTGEVERAAEHAQEIQNKLWAMAEQLAREDMSSEMISLYVSALNDMIDIHSTRLAAVHARVPPTVLLLLFFVSIGSIFLLGFSNSYNQTRSLVGLVILALIFSAVLFLIVDLDRPSEGLLRVSQEPMLNLQAQMKQ